jgi:hypothetical protein
VVVVAAINSSQAGMLDIEEIDNIYIYIYQIDVYIFNGLDLDKIPLKHLENNKLELTIFDMTHEFNTNTIQNYRVKV